MQVEEIIIGLIIHLFVPLIGLSFFLIIVNRMQRAHVGDAPILELFVVFATYGGLLLIVLTGLFWQWSGMASLGTFYSILGGPVVLAAAAYRLRRKRDISVYHELTFISSILYPFIAIGLILIIAVLIALFGK
ncbi:hypothetical protein F0P96_16110 [Hymenobacter busanensis]|uniref:Uncharacterized protein n=1 Tax=Hymenobacter busanensis TaxID=2607656 RepID=A0A7L4ZT82_9BACT|nr:hypothetical protein [Hymenobacter busanensis]KAA9327505.1 hypothetical protein F0P96_16110 [Hymenobacter busanensis]QHJ06157.1 hypothetical protein GUY19_02125 [Hymenobacter busanensis]